VPSRKLNKVSKINSLDSPALRLPLCVLISIPLYSLLWKAYRPLVDYCGNTNSFPSGCRLMGAGARDLQQRRNISPMPHRLPLASPSRPIRFRARFDSWQNSKLTYLFK
jgi:hypothetical protein